MADIDEVIADTIVNLTADGGKALLQLSDGTKLQVSEASTPAGLEGLILCKSTSGHDLWIRAQAIVAFFDKSD